MRLRRKPDQLSKYLIISIVLHLLILIFFPFGRMMVMGNKEGEREFAFVQVVEYQQNSTTTEPKQETKVVHKAEPKPAPKPKPEPKPQPKPEPKPKPKPEPRPEPEPEPKVEPKPVEKPKPQPKPEPKAEPAPEPREEIISSEQSDLEVKVSKKPATEPEQKVEPKPEQEGNPTAEQKVENDESSSAEEVEPAPTPPPPPPTSGQLIGLSVNPAYPKDLVSQMVEGTVGLLVQVNTEGKVESIEITSSSGKEQMDRTARLTVEKGWKFKKYDRPYSIPLVIEYHFDENGNSTVDVSVGKVTFK